LPTRHFAGRLRYDTVINGRTRILPTWLVTTTDPQLAARLTTLLGGEPHNDGDSQQPTYTVLTNHAHLDVLLDGPQAIRLQMLRRHGSSVMRCCNGRTLRTPLGRRPCQCPPTLKGRWQAAKDGNGCEPWSKSPFGSPPTRRSADSSSPAPPGRSPTTP
jgi:hypothetical protein